MCTVEFIFKFISKPHFIVSSESFNICYVVLCVIRVCFLSFTFQGSSHFSVHTIVDGLFVRPNLVISEDDV